MPIAQFELRTSRVIGLFMEGHKNGYRGTSEATLRENLDTSQRIIR